MTFLEKLKKSTQQNNSLVCVGLDPDVTLMPDKIGVFDFNKAIIDATANFVCAYKINLAFYEAMGDDGLNAMKRTVKHIPGNIPVIGDGKRGDIGNTSKAYAQALFTNLGFDAATVSPYLGFDSVEPFIQFREKGVFILCRTSNIGALDFQSLRCETEYGLMPLYQIVGRKAEQWNTYGNIGLVVGATYPEELKLIRSEHPYMPLLIPGVGAQGGELGLAVGYGVNRDGTGAIINSSRQIIYASRGKDFVQAAERAARTLRDQINVYRTQIR